jgi:hypothetical protein
MRCTATAKGTGERCRNFAVVGMTVCTMHGLTGNGFRKAEERVTLAQLLEGDRRHPWEVVLDATYTMDAIVRDFRAEVVAGETITVDQLDRLINVNQIRHHLATTAISTKAHEHVALAFEQHLELQGRAVGIAIGAAIDKLGLTEPWRLYALDVARRALLGDEAQGDEPQPPEDPVIAEYDVRPRGTAPALEAGTAVAVSPCDVAMLDDDALRSLGEAVLDELERRGVDG